MGIALPTYEAFADRYPWAVHPLFGGRTVTTRDDWAEAVGRLARYQYLNMDQVVGQALTTYEGLASRLAAAA